MNLIISIIAKSLFVALLILLAIALTPIALFDFVFCCKKKRPLKPYRDEGKEEKEF